MGSTPTFGSVYRSVFVELNWYIVRIVLATLGIIGCLAFVVYIVFQDPVRFVRGEPKFKKHHNVKDKFGDYDSER